MLNLWGVEEGFWIHRTELRRREKNKIRTEGDAANFMAPVMHKTPGAFCTMDTSRSWLPTSITNPYTCSARHVVRQRHVFVCWNRGSSTNIRWRACLKWTVTLWGFRFSPRWLETLMSLGMWLLVDGCYDLRRNPLPPSAWEKKTLTMKTKFSRNSGTNPPNCNTSQFFKSVALKNCRPSCFYERRIAEI